MKILKYTFSAVVIAFALSSHADNETAWLSDSIQTNLVDSINSQLIPMRCVSPNGSFESYFPNQDSLQAVSKNYDYETARCQRTDLITDRLYTMGVGLFISIQRTVHYTSFSAQIRLPLGYFPSQEKLAGFLSDLADKTENDAFPSFNREEIYMKGASQKGSIMIPYTKPGAMGTLKLDYEIKGDEIAPDSSDKRLEIKISTDIQV